MGVENVLRLIEKERLRKVDELIGKLIEEMRGKEVNEK